MIHSAAELTEAAEAFLEPDHTYDRLRKSAVYALELERPDNLPDVWDATFDTRPEYWGDLLYGERVIYVGSAKDLLARLEDHADGEKRVTVLAQVCTLDGLFNVWWVAEDRRRIEESRIALELQAEHPAWFIHQR